MSYTPSELLKEHNYTTWAEELEAWFMTQSGGDVWLAIDPDTEVPQGHVKQEKWKKHNLFAYGTIFRAIHPDQRSVLSDLVPKKCGRTAWAGLRAHYLKDTPSYRHTLRQKFYSLSYSPSTGVSGYSDSLKRIIRDLKDIGHELSRLEVLDKLLIGLPSSFAPIRTTIMPNIIRDEYKLQDAVTELQDFEHREGLTPQSQIPENIADPSSLPNLSLANQQVTPSLTALYSSHAHSTSRAHKDFNWLNTENRENVCWRCGKSGHGAPRCVFDMPKEVKDKILKVSTVKSAKTEEVFYFDDHLDLAAFTTSYTPPLSSLQTLHTDPIESIIEPTIHTAHAIFTDTPDTPTSSCSTCKSHSRSRSPTL